MNSIQFAAKTILSYIMYTHCVVSFHLLCHCIPPWGLLQRQQPRKCSWCRNFVCQEQCCQRVWHCSHLHSSHWPHQEVLSLFPFIDCTSPQTDNGVIHCTPGHLQGWFGIGWRAHVAAGTPALSPHLHGLLSALGYSSMVLQTLELSEVKYGLEWRHQIFVLDSWLQDSPFLHLVISRWLACVHNQCQTLASVLA